MDKVVTAAPQRVEAGLVPHEASAQIMQLMDKALDRGVSVESLEKLVALHERMTARQAAAEFAGALVRFQAECPPIEKTSTAKVAMRSGGEYSYSYAALDQIARTIRPLIEKCGLSYTWDTEDSGNLVKTTCRLWHVGGHSTTATFTCPVDTAAAMSGAQKHAAALTSARRQSLVQVLGLTMCDPDTDAQDETKITEEQERELEDWIASVGADRAKFLVYLRVTKLSDLRAADFGLALQALKAKERR